MFLHVQQHFYHLYLLIQKLILRNKIASRHYLSLKKKKAKDDRERIVQEIDRIKAEKVSNVVWVNFEAMNTKKNHSNKNKRIKTI